jgi:H3 lysine-79-specific histone-lysine N-methyltransferase
MNSFNLGGAKKPVIRREKVLVPTNVPKTNSASSQLGSRRPGPPANRFQLSATTTSTLSKQLKNPAQRAVASTRGVKRKSATPQPSGPLWSDDEGQDDDSSEIGGSDSDASRKRVKSSVSSVESNGPRRTLASETVREEGKAIKFVHASTLTSKDQESKFKNAFKRDSTTTVSLQYPSRSPSEKFQLKRTKTTSLWKILLRR